MFDSSASAHPRWATGGVERQDSERESDRNESGSSKSSCDTGSDDRKSSQESHVWKIDDASDDSHDDDGDRTGEQIHLLGRETDQILNHNTPLVSATARQVGVELPILSGPHLSAEDESRPRPVSWSSLPKKSQLAVLTLARLSEPLAQTSLQSYMFYQLKSFHKSGTDPPSDASVAKQVGLLAAAFTGAQFLTAMLWGRIADSKHVGRKRVILIGLIGTAMGSLGFGFSGSFGIAMFWRSVGGILNGNVGVMRTMISEIVQEKKYQSRAFLLMPMCFNIGTIIGPLLGGLLADPVGSYPGFFGPGGWFGGEHGIEWLIRWPYALPNVVNAAFLSLSALAVMFGLEETLEELREQPDRFIQFRQWLVGTLFGCHTRGSHSVMRQRHDSLGEDVELMGSHEQSDHLRKGKPRHKLPVSRMFTTNVIATLICHGLLATHVGTFHPLWFLLLSTPRYNPNGDNKTLRLPKDYHPSLPFVFTGGLALPPPSIGTALAILGTIGISLQLFLYPGLSFRLGTIVSYRLSTILFPIAYSMVPFLVLLPLSTLPPAPGSGIIMWLGITCVLTVQVLGRTFALPSVTILVNNASPHPSVLGTMHGLAQSVSSGCRTLGPALMGWLYGIGLSKGMVGVAWWVMAGIAVLGSVAGCFVKEGNGHEILLDGEDDDD